MSPSSNLVPEKTDRQQQLDVSSGMHEDHLVGRMARENSEAASQPRERHSAGIRIRMVGWLAKHLPEPVPSGSPCTLWHHVLEVPKAAIHRLAVDGEIQLVRDILKGDGALAPRHVERMSLQSPPLYEGADERLVNLEPALGQSCTGSRPARCTNGSARGSRPIAICRRTLTIHLSFCIE
ncbi:hypothetical protein PIB30_011141 [Stylosanthes scabra]|uniref:Uncharacterized protein n=1 Tax=Stylosanthes scabra TaxID=79078 RepID=A0ABU6Q6J0_9FABA|nr:hypothetical protein [Stylosanthes scabra]